MHLRNGVVSIFAFVLLTAGAPKPTTQEVYEAAIAATKKSEKCTTKTYRFREITDGADCNFRLETVADDHGQIIKTFQAKNDQDITKYELTYLQIDTIDHDEVTERTLTIKGTITHRLHGDYVVNIEKKK